MINQSDLLTRYREYRNVREPLLRRLAKMIPSKLLKECAQKLGMFHDNILILGGDHEHALLMEQCIHHPGPDGHNLVDTYLEQSPPPRGSAEMAALQAMARAYYSLFQVTEVKRGLGVSVVDLLRRETGFIVDLGFGETAQKDVIIATRIVSMDDWLITGGAALPVEPVAAERIVVDLKRMKLTSEEFDFKRITSVQEWELSAHIIRTCLAALRLPGAIFQLPDGPSRSLPERLPVARAGRNDPCPCDSGKKFKKCCGRN